VEEIAAGLWHWKALRESIGAEVSSYYLARELVLIDPMIPPEGFGWFDEHGRPDHLLLTNRHHDRDAWKLLDAFGCEVHCIRNGLHELEGRGPVVPFDFEDELPGGVVAYEVDAICPAASGSPSVQAVFEGVGLGWEPKPDKLDGNSPAAQTGHPHAKERPSRRWASIDERLSTVS
jgi:hypothetical protein